MKSRTDEADEAYCTLKVDAEPLTSLLRMIVSPALNVSLVASVIRVCALLDDMLSMFPFKNSVIYLEHKGSVLRKTFEEMAANSFHVLGGVKIIAENGKLVSVEIAGEPLDDDKVYGVVTNSFLLYGGDGLFLATDAVEMKDLGVLVSDVMLDYVKGETAAGRQLTGSTDGRIIIKKQGIL